MKLKPVLSKIKFFFLLCSFVSLFKSSFSQQWKWLNQSGGNSSDKGISLDIDKFGNVYQTGTFINSSNFGGKEISSSGQEDIFISKYNFDGVILWTKKAGGAGKDAASALKIIDSKYIYLTGIFNESITFKNINLISKGGTDYFLAKYDTAGNVIWAKSWGGARNDESSALAYDEEGNLYLTGFSEYLPENISSLENKDQLRKNSFLTKLDENGNRIWHKTLKGSDDFVATSVSYSGNFIAVAGYFLGKATLDKKSLKSNGEEDAFIAIYDDNGLCTHATGIGGIKNDRALGIALNEYDEIFITGSNDLNYLIDNDSIKSNFSPLGGIDAFVAKFDNEGTVVWHKTIGGSGHDRGNSIAIDNKNRIFVTGNLGEESTLDSIAASVPYKSFIVQLDEEGELKYASKSAGQGTDNTHSIATRSNNLYVTGEFNKGIDYENFNLESQGLNDNYIARLSLQPKKDAHSKTAHSVIKVGMFPNPITTNLNILFQPSLDDTFKTIEVLNSENEVLKREVITGRYLNINAKLYEEGEYSVKIETEEHLGVYHFLINRSAK
jgi:hypothetical protein